MRPGLIYAVVCATCVGFSTILHSAASRHVSSALGAILVSGTAVLVGAMFVVPSIRAGSLVWTSQGLVLVGLAGICAFAIDYFALRAYAEGLPVSIGGPIIIGGSIGLATIIGLAFGESISLMKVAGISLVLVGASLLAALSPE